MTNENKDSQKIRFKFANGEEFEAEGTPDFIEKQRDYFLTLVKKKPLTSTAPLTGIIREDTSVSGTLTQPFSSLSSYEKRGLSSSAVPSEALPTTNNSFSNHLWEQLLGQEGDILFLRRKLRLSPTEGALLLLAGGRELLKKPGCSALWLSRALEKSGFSVPRLDRLLAPVLSLGYLQSEGIKRSRLYALTPAGLAHTFVLAEKKAEGLL